MAVITASLTDADSGSIASTFSLASSIAEEAAAPRLSAEIKAVSASVVSTPRSLSLSILDAILSAILSSLASAASYLFKIFKKTDLILVTTLFLSSAVFVAIFSRVSWRLC